MDPEELRSCSTTTRGRRSPSCERSCGGSSPTTCRPTTSAPSPTTPPTSRWRSRSAACWPPRACCARRGPRSTAAGAPRPGSRRRCARRCGPTTSPAAPSTWGSTGSGRRSCATAPPTSSASTSRPSPPARSSGARASASPTPAPTWRRCRRPPAATATAGGSAARRSGPPTPRWPSGASCSPARRGARRSSRASPSSWCRWTPPASRSGRSRACSAPPPQRGLPRRRVGHRGRRAGRGRPGLEGGAGGPRLRAGRHRPLRPGRAAAAVGARRLGDTWDGLPDELRSRWSRMLVHARRARLLAYRVIATQQTGQVRPGDTAAYRIAVTRLDQESAEVLMDIAAEITSTGEDGPALPPGSRGPPPVLGVGHRGVRQHRDAADPARPSPAGAGVNTDLSPEAVEYGHTARRALGAAGGDELAHPARGSGTAGTSPRCSPTSAPGTSTPGAAPTSSRPPPRCAAARLVGGAPPRRRAAGAPAATSRPTPSSSWPATVPRA